MAGYPGFPEDFRRRQLEQLAELGERYRQQDERAYGPAGGHGQGGGAHAAPPGYAIPPGNADIGCDPAGGDPPIVGSDGKEYRRQGGLWYSRPTSSADPRPQSPYRGFPPEYYPGSGQQGPTHPQPMGRHSPAPPQGYGQPQGYHQPPYGPPPPRQYQPQNPPRGPYQQQYGAPAPPASPYGAPQYPPQQQYGAPARPASPYGYGAPEYPPQQQNPYSQPAPPQRRPTTPQPQGRAYTAEQLRQSLPVVPAAWNDFQSTMTRQAAIDFFVSNGYPPHRVMEEVDKIFDARAGEIRAEPEHRDVPDYEDENGERYWE